MEQNRLFYILLSYMVMGAGSCQKCPDNSYATRGRCPNTTGGTVGTGGSVNTGGSPRTGGSVSNGGKIATGGNIATGGSSIPVACPTFVWPSVLSATPAEQERKAIQRKFPARGYHTLRALTDYEVSVTICSSWNEPLVKVPLDQGSTGSCEGNAADGVISTYPYPERGLYNENTARQIYENGTCIDNGCLIPCTCSSCTKAFCPTTNANDTGSQGSSVFAYLIKMGWIKGQQLINSTDRLALALTHSSCDIGIDYYYSMMSTDATGRLVVNISSGLAGGHALHSLGWDAINSRFWGRSEERRVGKECTG
jgi:hypothetical protein